VLEADAARLEARHLALDVVDLAERLARLRRSGAVSGVVEEAGRVRAQTAPYFNSLQNQHERYCHQANKQ